MGNQLLIRLKRLLRWLLILAGLAFLGWIIYLRWQEVQDFEFTFNIIPFLGGLSALFFFYGLYSQSWKRILYWLSTEPLPISSLRQSRIFFAAFITRYLPAGKLINIGTRIELLHREGGSRLLGAESLIIEQIYLIGTTILLAWLAYLHTPITFFNLDLEFVHYLVISGGLVFLIVLVIGPAKLLLQVMNRFSVSTHTLSTELSVSKRLDVFLRFLFVNILQGTSITLILWSVFPAMNLGQVPLFWLIVAYPVSRFVGQIASIMPGGLGIREGVYVFILSGYLPVQPLLVASALMRLFSILMEVLILASLSLAIRLRESQQPPIPIHQD